MHYELEISSFRLVRTSPNSGDPWSAANLTATAFLDEDSLILEILKRRVRFPKASQAALDPDEPLMPHNTIRSFNTLIQSVMKIKKPWPGSAEQVLI